MECKLNLEKSSISCKIVKPKFIKMGNNLYELCNFKDNINIIMEECCFNTTNSDVDNEWETFKNKELVNVMVYLDDAICGCQIEGPPIRIDIFSIAIQMHCIFDILCETQRYRQMVHIEGIKDSLIQCGRLKINRIDILLYEYQILLDLLKICRDKNIDYNKILEFKSGYYEDVLKY